MEENNKKRADLNPLTLGYILRETNGIMPIPGNAYVITIDVDEILLIIPDTDKHKIVHIKGTFTERLDDMNDQEILDYIKFSK